jgi:hypothetical protein
MSDIPELAQSTGGLEQQGAYIRVDGPHRDSLQQSLDNCVRLTLSTSNDKVAET